MVNTRRMESSGSAHDSGPQYRTRSTDVAIQETDESSVSEDESSWTSKKKSPINVNRYTHNKHVLRKSNLSVYSPCKMHDDTDDSANETDAEHFSSRARKSRKFRHSRAVLSQLEKRTALSLRPISHKSYADHSPIAFNTDDSDVEKDALRRSKRKRRVRFSSMSWLTDNQMSKVGYPKLVEDYSEDSRDAQDSKHFSRAERENNIYSTRRTTRLSHEISDVGKREMRNNTKQRYLYEYDTDPETPNRNCHLSNGPAIPDSKVVLSKLKTREINDNKENKENNVENEPIVDKVRNKESIDTELVNIPVKACVTKASNGNISSTSKECKEVYPENDDVVKARRSLRRTRSRKSSDTSSSSEPSRVYSLRQRAPKPKLPMPVRAELENIIHPRRHPRRRFTRRTVSSSSSDSLCDSDASRKPSKYHSTNSVKSGSGTNKPLPIAPETIDRKVRFSSVGGLDGHIQCLKEMILLPMMYPEVFRLYQIQPPRGVLFHGPPGTGKTLIARALANECSFGSRKVSFFMQKGADLLSKWVGESEKQLRLLFEQAQELKPSIIFFDELDGLAPVRSSRQDQIHASIVSTLLALMDGIDNRGEVIVIGATNRIDAIDPALRRPGRFDRELFFPLPARKQRDEILKVHISCWAEPPSFQLLSYLSESTVGYCGSDLQALCSEAVIQSFRRTYPQIYSADHRLLLDPNNVKVAKVDFLRAKSSLIPASQRISQGLGKKLMSILEPLLKDSLKNTLAVLRETFPHGLNPILAKVKLASGVRPAQLLLLGDGPQHGQTLHLAPAILHHMEHIHAHTLDIAMLHCETSRSPEESCLQVFHEARRTIPSVIYIPNIDELWALVSETVKAILLAQLAHMDPSVPILLLASANVVFTRLPKEIQSVFSRYRREVYHLNPPTSGERKAFFKPLLIDTCIRTSRPPRVRATTPPPLPRAPTPPPTPITKENSKKLYEQEEHTLRELRIFLRDMCKKLASNKMFYMFTKPVDIDEVPDYSSIIKQPMDLETMMTKVDFHRYESARDFLNDVELIVQNALEYNPAKTSTDKQIRHRACSLRDYAYTLIKNEMDSDFEDKCQKISKSRVERKANVTQYLPAYINTPELEISFPKHRTVGDIIKPPVIQDLLKRNFNASCSPIRKRKCSWQHGVVKKSKRRHKTSDELQSDCKQSIEESKDNSSQMCSSTFNSVDNKNSAICLSLNTATTPLSVNCGSIEEKLQYSTPLQSPSSKRRLSELLSPSELLDDHLEFDDIDKSLNDKGLLNHLDKVAVDINIEELEKILEQTVKITINRPLQSLLDVHNQFARIVRQYSRTSNRRDLPKELRRELTRYKTELMRDSKNDTSS